MSETAEPINVERYVRAYLKLRDTIQENEKEHKAAQEKLQEKLDVIEAELLRVCNEQNLNGLRTDAGTITRGIRTRYWTQDWPSLYETIIKHKQPELLEQRIHTGNMKAFLEENPEAFPPGLQISNKYTITVRRAKAA